MKTIINNHIANIEIKKNQQKFYAVLRIDGETLGVSEHFNTKAAAAIAGELLAKHYKKHPDSASVL